MMSDMPLPTPRSEICSPSHMMKAEPGGSESTVSRTKPMPGLMTTPCPMDCKLKAMVVD